VDGGGGGPEVAPRAINDRHYRIPPATTRVRWTLLLQACRVRDRRNRPYPVPYHCRLLSGRLRHSRLPRCKHAEKPRAMRTHRHLRAYPAAATPCAHRKRSPSGSGESQISSGNSSRTTACAISPPCASRSCIRYTRRSTVVRKNKSGASSYARVFMMQAAENHAQVARQIGPPPALAVRASRTQSGAVTGTTWRALVPPARYSRSSLRRSRIATRRRACQRWSRCRR
jgi:hypothetical protein